MPVGLGLSNYMDPISSTAAAQARAQRPWPPSTRSGRCRKHTQACHLGLSTRVELRLRDRHERPSEPTTNLAMLNPIPPTNSSRLYRTPASELGTGQYLVLFSLSDLEELRWMSPSRPSDPSSSQAESRPAPRGSQTHWTVRRRFMTLSTVLPHMIECAPQECCRARADIPRWTSMVTSKTAAAARIWCSAVQHDAGCVRTHFPPGSARQRCSCTSRSS